MNKLFYIETYGCKLNQLDSERIRDGFHAAGYAETDTPELAEIIVINSCAVTGNAEKESRYRLRRIHRANPDARKYFIGCFTEKQEIPDTVFLRGSDKFGISELAANIPPFPEIQEKHVRPLIHIQTGCDLHCSYCIVPYFRGPSRSIPKERILEQVNAAVAAGRREGVFTGIHLGTWGKDQRPKQNLIDLLQFIEKHIKNSIKIRISSLDSNEIPDSLIDYLKSSEMVQPHFHIPLQSGSGAVLKRMKRRYTPGQYRTVLEKLKHALPHACIGADIIAGFPGETEKEFEECRSFILNCPLDYLHVFPFSPRSRTAAASMPEQITEAVKKERVKELKKLSDIRKMRFARHFSDTIRQGILIYPDRVLTDNYISVHLNENSHKMPGSEVNVKLSLPTPSGTVHGILSEES
ncbi:MAG: MiaB/RimO family radical SAM methylthiotransferase [Acidobacteria bacterium]|nr:MiaB/RimO family radical SAM methylthiotransferase [Acidobacteriota bacterium]